MIEQTITLFFPHLAALFRMLGLLGIASTSIPLHIFAEIVASRMHFILLLTLLIWNANAFQVFMTNRGTTSLRSTIDISTGKGMIMKSIENVG